ncbi:MAG: preprotein translocase subunit SecE [Candidatus Alcyoniella australis]|nr:preprotein translocase subunit SecE [Candidatus Alcyoniella australis]
MIAKSRQFLREVWIELKKVSWPTRQETVASTWVLIGVTGIFALFFFLSDSLISSLLGLVLSNG